MSVSVNGTNGLTFNDGSTQNTSPFAGGLGFRNRIINGDFRIDQRNAGASVTLTASAYTLDRWNALASTSSKYSVQQNAGSIAAPAGFTNYLGVLSLSAYTLGAGDFFNLTQSIEGYNIADLNWGTANAQPATLSFWVWCSLTGTFGGVISNQLNSGGRYYPFTYSIPVGSTWTKITVTIPGDTSGTWNTTNGTGMVVNFGLGVGSTYSGTAGAWSGTYYLGATGATSVVSSNAARFDITGVQLEKGSTATSFDYRPYGTELALCQRYYSKSYSQGTVPGTASIYEGSVVANAVVTAAGGFTTTFSFPVEMRAAPTITFYSPVSGASGNWKDSGATDKTVAVYNAAGTRSGSVYNSAAWSAAGNTGYGHWTAAIEL